MIASYLAINKALKAVDQHGALDVPTELKNAHTSLMKSQGFGEGYQYPHDAPHAIVKADYLPEKLQNAKFYSPSEWGYEKTIRERLQWWEKKKSELP